MESSAASRPDRFACVDIDLGALRSVSEPATTEGAGNEFTGSCGGDEAPELVFLWEVPEDGLYRIETSGSGFDTVLYLFNGSCSTDEVACNDDAPGGGGRLTSQIDVDAESGAKLLIVVDGFDEASLGSMQLHVSPIDQ